MKTERNDNPAQMKRCTFCGERLWVQDRFCPNCGSPATELDEPQTPGESGRAHDPRPESKAQPGKRTKRFWNRND